MVHKKKYSLVELAQNKSMSTSAIFRKTPMMVFDCTMRVSTIQVACMSRIS